MDLPRLQPVAAVALTFPLLLTTVASTDCAAATCNTNYGARVDLGSVQTEITEASGLVASRENADVFWTHNDSGDGNKVYALNRDAESLGTYIISGATARDWEDIALGPGPFPGVDYLYVGNIGDNGTQVPIKQIYRVPEPHVDAEQSPGVFVLLALQSIDFVYPDGMHNAEALLVDPQTRDIYVVTKGSAARVYVARYPQNTSSTIVLEWVRTLSISTITGGDISADGRTLILKNYGNAFVWCRDPFESIADMLADAPTVVPYTPEPQGEAICWDATQPGYYTLSEGPGAHLYFYGISDGTGVVDASSPATPIALGLARPNPVRLTTAIEFMLTGNTDVTLRVFNAQGRKIRNLSRRAYGAGTHVVEWDTRHETGTRVPNGVYYIKLEAGEVTRTRSVIVAR